MLINLCENYLETNVKCDRPSTDGYDVKNLLSDANSGFLAYSTIKPPINIDFHFICNIKLSHVIIWPCVGSQKSTGFKISTKFNHQQQHILLSSGFLNSNHMGIFFVTNYVNENAIFIPEKFFKVSIKNYHNSIIECLDNLRITIVKTDKSVPAINKIEIWGYVSSINKLENSNKIFNLLSQHKKFINQITKSTKNTDNEKTVIDLPIKSSGSLVIPEEYTDPITCTIMLQPIVLPSGKIIDNSTLQNYGENEALWGRPLSDPFTGILLSNNYKPIFASQLKLKIDKFLSENADESEIKQLPRIVGCKNNLCLPSYCAKDYHKTLNSKSCKETSNNMRVNKLNISKKNIRHQLPIVSRRPSCSSSINNINKVSKKVSTRLKTIVNQLENNDTIKNNCNIDDKLKNNLQNVLSNLKRFNDIRKSEGECISDEKKKICGCCEFPTSYKLPCDHIVCRKIILSHNKNNKNNSNMNLQCPECNFNYKSSDIIKFHNYLQEQ